MADTPRFLRLNAVVYGLGNHEAAWRMPESDPLAGTSLAYWVNLARIAERAGFDSLFLGDVLALLQGAENHLSDTLDPTMVMAALAAVTNSIGLIATLSTTFEPPFHIARRFASLDHLTGGRAGWNLVTSSNQREALNFGLDALPGHAQRYAMAADVLDAVEALWDSWAPDARLADQAAGRYLAAGKVHPIDHQGPFVRSKGPLNTPRCPQGRPLVVQAGSSEDGRALAAARADLVFTAQLSMEDAQAFYRDIKTRAAAAGRDPDSVLVMPGIMPVVAATREQAQARLDAIDAGIVHEHAMAQLGEYLQTDLSRWDLDAPLPETVGDGLQSQANQSRFALIVTLARRDGLTLRQLLQRVGGGRGHFLQAGSPREIADTMEQWFDNRAADGFSVMCPVLPADLDAFGQGVVPELRRRGLLGQARPGQTLRRRLGLPELT